MIRTRQKQVHAAQTAKKEGRAPIIKWKGVPMVRVHSFLAAVQEIIDFSAEIDLVRVGLIGDPHSGKSTMLEAISHTIHSRAKIPYAVKIFTKEDLIRFDETLKTLQPANYVLGFDDASFLEANATKKQIDIIKQSISTIRHLEGGQDKKIILVMNYHSVKALSPFLRQADFRFFTSVGSDTERSNMVDIMGTKTFKQITSFMKMRRQGIVKKYFAMMLPGQREPFAYKFRNPFIPVLFYNNASLRLIVSPTRQWLEPICTVCGHAKGTKADEISMQDFFMEGEKKFHKKRFLSAVRLVLHGNGINVFDPAIKQAIKFITRGMMLKQVSLDAMAEQYGLTVKNSRLRKPVDDGVFAKG